MRGWDSRPGELFSYVDLEAGSVETKRRIQFGVPYRRLLYSGDYWHLDFGYISDK